MDNINYEISSSDYKRENIFLRKNWLSTIDLNNGVYSTNQLVIDSSALSNSSLFCSYREGVVVLPLLLTLSCTTNAAGFAPNTTASSLDWTLGLKNWFGTIIHNMSLEMSGSTIVQTTPYQSMYQNFCLLTTLSYEDVAVLGQSLGFWPDTSLAVCHVPTTAAVHGIGVCNNQNFPVAGGAVSGAFNTYETFNQGLYKRQQFINFDGDGLTNLATGAAWSTLVSKANLNLMYKSNIINKANGTGAGNGFGVIQHSVVASIRLRDLHDFFEKIPMMKGAFFKLTLNLNQTSVSFSTSAGKALSIDSIVSPQGGISPIMIASADTSNGGVGLPASLSFIASIAVGADCLNTQQKTGTQLVSGFLRNASLIVPAYQFNPSYESSYLSNPIRQINYDDIYSYQVLNIGANGGNFNQLLTNGISGLKSILVVPVHTPAAVNGNISPLLSPFDPCGGGPSSPLVFLNNFQVTMSGQNQIYNTQISTYQNFWNNLNGCRCVNANQIDGMSGNGLLSQIDFETEYCYFYCDISRGLPIENSVAKSVSISGTNLSALNVDLYCFLVYETSISVNLFSGLRV
jgi:hypothetical protein